ncbi:dUTP diphosphatase [Bradyrhizobium sp. CCBAU 53380]|uniref:dUTP diphosphatase n=1 Tax=Bradyrhizobium sp. CCBAU 53380 TaxID=1325117 RepID=UPI002FE10DA1|nr:aminotransferase [Bradyrhizobium sp. CCBAU 53380]
MLKVQVKLLDERLLSWGFPYYGSSLAAGLDLFASVDEPIQIFPQSQPKLISTGISLHIGHPEWCAMIVPRSGQGHKLGLVLGNTVGVIDADYQGPCLVSAWNRNMEHGQAITINPGDRIAQLIFVHITRPQIEVVTEFDLSGNRGEGGWGSTGK